jgi:hypothetical protein
MNGPIRNAMRQLTRAMRPLAPRSAGKEGSANSVISHAGRRWGRVYRTPVVTVAHDGSFLIARPYGERTDRLKNVVAKGSATLITGGKTYQVDTPEVMPRDRQPEYESCFSPTVFSATELCWPASGMMIQVTR